MILFAKGREKNLGIQRPVLRSRLRTVPSQHVSLPKHAALLTGEIEQHLPMVEERGEGKGTLKQQRRFQTVFPNTQGICFLLVVSENFFKSTCASHLRRQNRKSHGPQKCLQKSIKWCLHQKGPPLPPPHDPELVAITIWTFHGTLGWKGL